MRNLIAKIFIGMLLICAMVAKTNNASANYGYSSGVPLVEVTDIENIPYPTTSNVYFYTENMRNHSKIELEEAGEVKAFVRWGAAVGGKGTVWFSRDRQGYDIVGDVKDMINRNENSLTVYLDKGTYYFNCIWSTEAYEVGVALLYERSMTEEKVEISSFNNSNYIELNRLYRGFLADTSPNDYYMFKLDKKAMVNIEYSLNKSSYNGRKQGECKLFNGEQIEIASGGYWEGSKGAESIEQLLEPGVYIIRLSGLNGVTTLKINTMYYDVNLVPDVAKGWTKGPMGVTINTSIDYRDIMVLNKNVSETSIDDRSIWVVNTWADDYVPIEGNRFEVKKNGTYTVRIEDKKGNLTLQKIKITTMDTKKPKVTGVTEGKAYKKSVVLKWSDRQSGINARKATLNGKKVKSGVRVTEQGKYTLKVYDKVGNVRKVKFSIDMTAPKVSGVVNGRRYNNSVTLRFKDNISGIKKITVNGDVVNSDIGAMTVWNQGKNTVKMWDNAGNSRSVVFYIR